MRITNTQVSRYAFIKFFTKLSPLSKQLYYTYVCFVFRGNTGDDFRTTLRKDIAYTRSVIRCPNKAFLRTRDTYGVPTLNGKNETIYYGSNLSSRHPTELFPSFRTLQNGGSEIDETKTVLDNNLNELTIGLFACVSILENYFKILSSIVPSRLICT